MTTAPPTETPQGSVCATHPEVPASATCSRCGAFACADCVNIVNERLVCPACFARPEVDYLGEFKRKMWGKRDGYVWWFGILGTLVTGLSALALGGFALSGDAMSAVVAVIVLLQTVVFVSYLFLRPWARAGLFGVLGLNIAILALLGGPEAIATASGQQIMPLVFFIAAWNSARNRLAFRIEVPQKKLKKMYDTFYDNQVARAGLLIGVLSMFVPGLFVVSLPLSILGLTRVNPEAWPPVGRKKSAIAGIVTSVIGVATTAALVLMLLEADRY